MKSQLIYVGTALWGIGVIKDRVSIEIALIMAPLYWFCSSILNEEIGVINVFTYFKLSLFNTNTDERMVAG
jgi:hypothetical protein